MTERLTERGKKDLTNKLKNMYALYMNSSDKEYPHNFRMAGFPNLKLQCRDELKWRIKELEHVLCIEVYHESP